MPALLPRTSLWPKASPYPRLKSSFHLEFTHTDEHENSDLHLLLYTHRITPVHPRIHMHTQLTFLIQRQWSRMMQYGPEQLSISGVQVIRWSRQQCDKRGWRPASACAPERRAKAANVSPNCQETCRWQTEGVDASCWRRSPLWYRHI